MLFHIPIEWFTYINFVCDEETQVKLFGALDMQKPADVQNQLVGRLPYGLDVLWHILLKVQIQITSPN